MYTPFENLPEDSKIWIYPSNRKLTEEEVVAVTSKCQQFVENWSAHGSSLEASFQLLYNRFIIFGVNAQVQQPTGCSIDASVHFIQQLEQDFQIELLDKMNVTYKIGEHITHKTLIDFKKMAKDKAVTSKTIVFNNLINTKGELEEFWEVPAEESWHSRFF